MSYQQRQSESKVEKCNIHTTKSTNICCDECKIPLCSECTTTSEHEGHTFADKETFFLKHQPGDSRHGKFHIPISRGEKRTADEMDAGQKTGDSSKRTRQQGQEKKEQSISKEAKDDKMKCLASSLTKLGDFKVPEGIKPWHISREKSGKLWISNFLGDMVQIEDQGNQLMAFRIQSDTGENYGFHTLSGDGDLFYIDNNGKFIQKMTPGKKFSRFIITIGDWRAQSVYSSPVNGDILVGLSNGKDAKLTRYSKTGKKIFDIQKDDTGKELYKTPHYIAENINGDICTSDFYKHAVVVVNKSGKYRFSYTHQEPSGDLLPTGIATDSLGHILVCSARLQCNNVHLLNQDGTFLSLLITPQHGVTAPRGLYIDENDNLYVGDMDNQSISVYKYLQ